MSRPCPATMHWLQNRTEGLERNNVCKLPATLPREACISGWAKCGPISYGMRRQIHLDYHPAGLLLWCQKCDVRRPGDWERGLDLLLIVVWPLEIWVEGRPFHSLGLKPPICAIYKLQVPRLHIPAGSLSEFSGLSFG